MNKERLQTVLQSIIAHKEQFDYSKWCTYRHNDPDIVLRASTLLTDCNAVGCIAGFTCALYKPETYRDYYAIARYVLDLTLNEADFLLLGLAEFGLPEIEETNETTVDNAIERINILLQQPENHEHING
jgi:hypothetical protein